jgi:predicted ribosome quality control (RQC) complex YloA/Tae2 family protein
MASKGRPYKAVVVDGWEILVGRGDAENDRLSLEIAAPQDLWLHVAGGVAGSHVVVRVPEGDGPEPPREVVLHAARLAAWNSKARGARGKVEVHLCRAGDVRKPRGFPPGMVELRRWESLKVYAKEPEAGGGGLLLERLEPQEPTER